jgi:hypothetical protein
MDTHNNVKALQLTADDVMLYCPSERTFLDWREQLWPGRWLRSLFSRLALRINRACHVNSENLQQRVCQHPLEAIC